MKVEEDEIEFFRNRKIEFSLSGFVIKNLLLQMLNKHLIGASIDMSNRHTDLLGKLGYWNWSSEDEKEVERVFEEVRLWGKENDEEYKKYCAEVEALKVVIKRIEEMV